ncbi:RagB/SusD family nutrient uptake outer membrane protein [Carboxylicivirga sp. RSCT41]|uniref:RagB/SusD family nutrient uptake outer membrane protein n=1 Tax=Carboxylicivirga agarovorans TaxID=3417570 RepID=UPI003D32DBFF
MKLNIAVKSIVIALFTFSSISCSDFLDTKPSTSVGDEEAFKTYVNAKASLIGTYDQLSSYAFDGLYVPIMGDLMGEDVMLDAEDNWGWFVAVYQQNVLPNYTWVSSPWVLGYKIIYDANQIIDKAVHIENITESERAELESQARIMRAYVNLKLIQMYAPAVSVAPEHPGILHAIKPLVYGDEDQGRVSTSVIYDLIVSDLTSAISLIDQYDLEYGQDATKFFGKRAAHAVLARAYLNLEEWNLALDHAALARKDMELMTINDITSGFMSPNRETIFSIAYTSDDNNIYLSLPSFYFPASGYSSIRIDSAFVNHFPTGDRRRTMLLKEYQFTPDFGLKDDKHMTFKFRHNGKIGNAERIAIRAGEMLLIEAECEAELGNSSRAQDLLLEIQKNAYPGAIRSKNTGEALVNEILLERRKELYGEGFRWNDIVRRNLPVKRSDDHWVEADFGPEDQEYYKMTFPIPQREIDVNEALTDADQNPGY